MEVGIMREAPASTLFERQTLEGISGMIKSAATGEGNKAGAVVESKAEKVVSRLRATAEAAESAGLPMIKVTADGKRMHLVSKQFINELNSGPLFRVPGRVSNERLLSFVRGDQAKYAMLISGYDAMDKVQDMEMSILKQYHDKGYAYFEITDDADEV